MKVALVQAPVWWTTDPPLGLAQIAGCARAAGHDTRVYDLNIRLWKERLPKYENMWLWEQFHFWNNPDVVKRFFRDNSLLVEAEVEKILRSDAKVIGFSVYLGAQWASLEVSRLIKKADPSRVIVWGGQFFFKGETASEWIKNPEIDAIVRGHGDFVFPELLKKIEAAGISPIAGVACKAGDGGEAPPIEDLDSVPFADISGFPLEVYTDAIRIPFAASRGCVWKCHFCSSTQFWPGYSYMSGERVFAEVRRHKELFPWKCHLEFYDIVANGSVKSLARFSELTAEKERALGGGLQYGWKINAIIRPEMTREVLDSMKKARCQDVIYGIESGSPKVLKLMNKPFRIDVAERVLRDTHEAGITATGNFMFGFPGETEDDFQQTLAFIKRNRGSLDRVYASATFTSLEEHSHLTDNRKDMGIKDDGAFHNLYWESQDGSNDYEVRLDRYKRFREAAIALGIDAYKGINGNLEQDQQANLAQYKQFRADHLGAIGHFVKYLETDLYNGPMRAELAAYLPLLRAVVDAQRAVEKANRLLEREPAQAESLLARGRRKLEAMPPDRRAGVHERDGRYRIVWIDQEAPAFEKLEPLLRRAELILGLAEGEVARGDDKKEAPRCQR